MASCSSARNAVSKQSICISNQVSVLWSSLLGWPRLCWISIMVWGSSCWLGLPRALFLADVSEWYLSLKAFPAQVRFLLLVSCTWILSSLPKDYILFYRESVYSCIAPKLTSLPIIAKTPLSLAGNTVEFSSSHCKKAFFFFKKKKYCQFFMLGLSCKAEIKKGRKNIVFFFSKVLSLMEYVVWRLLSKSLGSTEVEDFWISHLSLVFWKCPRRIVVLI